MFKRFNTGAGPNDFSASILPPQVVISPPDPRHVIRGENGNQLHSARHSETNVQIGTYNESVNVLVCASLVAPVILGWNFVTVSFIRSSHALNRCKWQMERRSPSFRTQSHIHSGQYSCPHLNDTTGKANLHYGRKFGAAIRLSSDICIGLLTVLNIHFFNTGD